jgi:hypothetical protein
LNKSLRPGIEAKYLRPVDKTTGALVSGPIAGNALWAGFGGECQSFNEGDINAQWDKAVHRWFLAQNVLFGGLGAA